MQMLDKHQVEALSAELNALGCSMLDLEATLLKQSSDVHEAHRRSARNLVHYLAMRQHDLRPLQSKLAHLGLSSLGRAESHVLSTVLIVQRALNALLGGKQTTLSPDELPVDFDEGVHLLKVNTDALLGPAPADRQVRIMVTMASDAATNYELVRDLVRNGMDCMRINCAHDGPDVWLAMIRNLQKAREETGRGCRVLMDLAGPKLRTGPIEPGPAVVKCRPTRDVYGRVLAPVRIWLTPGDQPEPPPATAAASIPLARRFLRQLRTGDILHLRDARSARRTLRIVRLVGESCWAETTKTIYFKPGIQVHGTAQSAAGVHRAATRIRANVGELPALPQVLLLRPGDTLILNRDSTPGRPATYRKNGQVISPASIGLSLPEILDHAKPGEPVWLDDGKIGGVFRDVNPDFATVEIVHARPEGDKLGAEKGINLPETRIDIAALTPDDLEALKFIVQHADIVGYSFVKTATDVHQLLQHLEKLGGQDLGLILKIETRKGFENLPRLILAAMRTRSVGIMIARGDLAVECGFERLAEIQEEILWICEAAHVPVIWATQVLETLAKTGIPSRSEVTDAAMGERAECVMLNKGPFTTAAVSVLADILTRMQAHQDKKQSMLRSLHIAASPHRAASKR